MKPSTADFFNAQARELRENPNALVDRLHRDMAAILGMPAPQAPPKPTPPEAAQ